MSILIGRDTRLVVQGITGREGAFHAGAAQASAMRPIGLPPRTLRPRLTGRSDLRPIVLRMISMNSLAAFTAEVSRAQGPSQARGLSPMGAAGQVPPAPDATRRLDALPPPPASPLPRGSLLDLKV